MIEQSIDIQAYIPLILNIVGILSIVGFGGIIVYLKMNKKTTDVQTACQWFAQVVALIESVPSVSPTIVSGMNAVLKAICTGQPLPDPLPKPVDTTPAGVSWIFAGSNKVALISEKQWRAGGGKILVDGPLDKPEFFSWAYLDTNPITREQYVHYDLQAYYDLEANTLHSLVPNPFDYETPPA